MPNDISEQRKDARPAPAFAGEQGEQEIHEIAFLAVGDDLNVCVFVCVNARADGNAVPYVIGVVGQRYGEHGLAVGTNQLAEPVADVRQ